MDHGISRRRVLQMGAGAAAALASPAVAEHRAPEGAAPGAASVSAAAPAKPAHVVFVSLRGGADVLSLLVPYRSATYHRARPLTAIAPPGAGGPGAAIALDDHFALHPALAGLKPFFDAGELGAVVGVGTPERIRSHRAAQAALDAALRRAAGDEQLSPGAPGELRAARSGASVAGSAPSARVVWHEIDGWDTHMAQGQGASGRFAGLAHELAGTLLALRAAAGAAWAQTLVVVNTEFGRSLDESGLRGTEDGHASALLLFGGGRGRGRVLGSYGELGAGPCPAPGLRPSLDLETLLSQSVRGEV